MGTAYKEGFNGCTGDLVFSMASNLSHNSKYLPVMIENISKSDMVIGSRICVGGIIIGRIILRDFFTYLTNFIIRFSVDRNIQDWTSGLRLYRRAIWEQIMPDVHCNKWDFQFENLYHSQKIGAIIKEIPITFHEHAGGSSKFNFLDAILFLRSFFRILLE